MTLIILAAVFAVLGIALIVIVVTVHSFSQ